MYHHIKNPCATSASELLTPASATCFPEQPGGANGELAAALQYSIQGLNYGDPARPVAEGTAQEVIREIESAVRPGARGKKSGRNNR